MARIQQRADRLVRRVFRRPAQTSQPRDEKVTKLYDKLRKRREQVLKTRRGL